LKHLRIALLQDEPGSDIGPEYLSVIQKTRPDILSFPEYYFVRPELENVVASISNRDVILSRIMNWSIKFDCVIVGGTIVDREGDQFRNRCYLVNRGRIIGHYDKIHLFKNEGGGLISPGKEYAVFDIGGLKIGILICADVLFSESFQGVGNLNPDLIIVPTTSPFKAGETADEKFARDETIFARGAEVSDSLIFKVSACGSIIGHKLQGRSLIAGQGKVLWRILPEEEQLPALIIADLRGDKANPSIDISVHRK